MKRLLIFTIISFVFIQLKSQDIALLHSYQDSILFYSKEIRKNLDNDKKLQISDKISEYVTKLIKQEKSIDFDLSSLKVVKVLTSKNKEFRVFTWVIPFSDKTFAYRGIAQTYSSSKKDFRTYKLNDAGDKLGYSAQNKTLNPRRWYGAYYYKIIETKKGKKMFYTLLGWRGVSKTIQSKIIEIATVKSSGDITFGYSVFNIKDYEYFAKNRRSAKRLIFKHSTQGNMFIDYDFQTLVIKTKKKNGKKQRQNTNSGFYAQSGSKKAKVKTKLIKDNMIILDRLVATSPQMVDFYDFYYPESNIMDALRWENNKWKYYADIDARNEESENTKSRINYGLEPK